MLSSFLLVLYDDYKVAVWAFEWLAVHGFAWERGDRGLARIIE